MDAIHGWGRKSRIFLVTLAAVFATYWAMLYRYVFEDETLSLGPFGTISLTERISGSFEIEGIFLAKQAMLTIYNGTHRCTAVKYSPYIEWRKTLDADISLFSRTNVIDRKDLPQQNEEVEHNADDEKDADNADVEGQNGRLMDSVSPSPQTLGVPEHELQTTMSRAGMKVVEDYIEQELGNSNSPNPGYIE